MLRQSGVIHQSTALAVHNSNAHEGDALYIGEFYNNNSAAATFMHNHSAGNGTTNIDAVNIEHDLSSGAGAAGYATHNLNAANRMVTLGAKPIIFTARIRNVVNGAGVDRHTLIGFTNDFTTEPLGGGSGIYFHQQADNTWVCRVIREVVPAGFVISSALTINDDDILSIVATSGRARFYQNGTLVFDTTEFIPAMALDMGAGCYATAVTVAGARSISLVTYTFVRYV